MIKEWIEARVWQIGAIGGGLVAAGLAVSLAITAANLHRVEKERDDVRASITAPVTGWAARLTTAQNNAATLEGRVKDQNARIDALGRDSAARLAEAEKALTAAQRGQAVAEAKVAKIMKPLVGADTCLRVIEADERLMESLR